MDADCPSGQCGVGVAHDYCTHNIRQGCRDEDDTCHGDESCADSHDGTYCLYGGYDGFGCSYYNVWD